jgi:hypothetical protein
VTPRVGDACEDSLVSTPPAAPPDTTSTPKRRKFPRWRRILSAVLIVLSCVLIPLSVIAVWVHDNVLDNGGYVDTVAPLADDPRVQEALSIRLTNTLFDNLDVNEIAKENLPPRIAFLAGPLTQGLENFTQETILKFLQSDTFEKIWDRVNDLAHRQVKKALTGGGEVVSTKNGRVVLDLSPLVDDVKHALDDRGISVFDKVKIDQSRLQFTLFEAASLRQAQQGVRLLNTLRYVLPILVVVFAAAGVLLAYSPRRGLIRWGIGMMIATALVGLGLAFGRNFMLDALPASASRSASSAAFDIIVRVLRNTIRVFFLIGALVALGAYLAGGGRVARAIRGRTTGVLDEVGDRTAASGSTLQGISAFVAKYATALRIAGFVLAFVVLVALDNPKIGALLVLVLLLLLYLAAVQVLERVGRDRAREGTSAAR